MILDMLCSTFNSDSISIPKLMSSLGINSVLTFLSVKFSTADPLISHCSLGTRDWTKQLNTALPPGVDMKRSSGTTMIIKIL